MPPNHSTVVLHCPSGRTGSAQYLYLPTFIIDTRKYSVKDCERFPETLGYMIKNTCQHNTKTDTVSNSKGADFRKGPKSVVRGVPRVRNLVNG